MGISHRAVFGVLMLSLAAVSGWSTGVLEYTPPESQSTGNPESDQERVETESAGLPCPECPECPECENAAGARTAAAQFVPTFTYPDTLFLPFDSRILGDTNLADFLASMEADRLLLSELRKPVPDTREAATVFLNRLKRLAEMSDPVRLAMAANRVLEQAPIYFDWLETEFESEQDEVYEYYIGGAQGFSRAFQEFENAVLMTAINRLDTASRIIQESNSASE